jgi:hypothetical protein
MARVLIDLPKHKLSKEQRGAGFEVFEPNGNGKTGDLIASQGGLRWYPRGARNARYVTWKKFDELMSDNGKQEKG